METIPPTLLRVLRASSWATLARLCSAATAFPLPDAGRREATPPKPPVLPETLVAWAAARWPGLTIEWVDLHQPMARYSNGGLLFGGAVVQIDRRLQGPELTCALAEELGHHATLMDAGRERRWTGRMLLSRRNEAAALRWAARVLIPEGGIREGDRVEDVAERWAATVEFARRVVEIG